MKGPRSAGGSALSEGMKAYRRIVARNRAIAAHLAGMEPKLRRKANVVGYAVGLKKTPGGTSERPAAIFYVSRKAALGKLGPKDRLPRWIVVKGARVPTDVIVLRSIKALGSNAANIARQRPIKMGAQIEAMLPEQNTEAVDGGWGTAGAIVKTKKPVAEFLLSCAHVLVKQGNDLIQPSKANGQGNSTKQDREKKPKPDFKDTTGGVLKLAGGGVDAGYAEADACVKDIIGIAPYASPQVPVPGLPVMKSGAATGVTTGTIDTDDARVFERLLNSLSNKHPEIFTGQTWPSLKGLFLIKPATFAESGDSGSLVVVGPEDALAKWIDNNPEIAKLNLKQKAKDALKKELLYSAVGLLCYSGLAGSIKYQGFMGQRIQVALDALDVDLA